MTQEAAINAPVLRRCTSSSAATGSAFASASRSSAWPPIIPPAPAARNRDRKSTRLNSSHGYISYAVFCLKKKKQKYTGSCEPGRNVSTRTPCTFSCYALYFLVSHVFPRAGISFFFFNDTATTEIYPLSLHDALPICLAAMPLLERGHRQRLRFGLEIERLAADHPAGARRPEQRSEEHTSELQSRLHLVCRLLLEKKKTEIHRQLRARTQRIDTNTMYILLLRSVLLGFSCLPARWYLFFFF